MESKLPAWSTVRHGCAIAGSALLLVCVIGYVWCTRGWPLVNDPALMSYVVLLMGRGLAPYRQISDINFPGAYMPEWISMAAAHALHVGEAAAWRTMDFLALLLAGVATVRIARPWSRFAGVWAGALFALYHGRDGIGQAGQRDLWIAVLLLWAVAALCAALRSRQISCQHAWLAAFGAAAGCACTVKPLGALTLLLLCLPVTLKRLDLLLHAFLGFLLPLLAMLAALLHWSALPAFAELLRTTLPYHARLGTGTVPQLLARSMIPSVGKLLLLGLLLQGVVAWAWRAGHPVEQGPANAPVGWFRHPERAAIALGAALGLVSFVAQGKGYPYHRYPFVALLLLLLGLDFAAAVRGRGMVLRSLGAAGLTFGVVLCAPTYLRGAARAQWSSPVYEGIEMDLREVSGQHPEQLDGQVQCLDVVDGCMDALLHLHLREATGTLYDEFLFPQTASGWGIAYNGPLPGTPTPAAVLAGQRKFQGELLENPPHIFLLTAWLFPQGPGEYRELQLWPSLAQYLKDHYTLRSEHTYSRAENGPMGFRLYVRKMEDDGCNSTPLSISWRGDPDFPAFARTAVAVRAPARAGCARTRAPGDDGRQLPGGAALRGERRSGAVSFCRACRRLGGDAGCPCGLESNRALQPRACPGGGA